MILTVIAEPRSGGQNLFKWLTLSLGGGFHCVHEPFNEYYDDYTTDITMQDFSWVDPEKNYFIKEIFRVNMDNNKLISLSDKVIALYRENIIEQSKSLFYAEKTRKYNIRYTQKDFDSIFNNEEYLVYKKTLENSKPEFKKFIKNNNLDFVTYEDLYYGEGIKKVIDIFGIDSKIPFPVEPRYFMESPKLI